MKDSPGKYKFLPHTADAKFIAYGKTIEEMFTNAAVATFEILTDTNIVKPVNKYEITLSAKNIEALLFDFIDEILFLLDTEGMILSKIEDLKIEHNSKLTCVVYGDYHKNYDVSCNVKAVTYNDMYVKKSSEGFECQVVVDL